MKKRILALLLAVVLVIGTSATVAGAASTDESIIHTVVSGDNLSSLAQKYLGDSRRWSEIYQANRDIISNPNLIFIGQKLIIPNGETPEIPVAPTAPAEDDAPEPPTVPTVPEAPVNSTQYPELVFDNTKWEYDPAVNCYYQIGIEYCTDPESLQFETLAVYVPGEYMTAVDNGNGTYTCSINPDGKVNGFNATTAPMVIPVKTPGYMALAAQTVYKFEDARPFVNAGFIYVHAGCRGRNNVYDDQNNLLASGGAPWGVTDLKAAVRYLRYNGEAMPGSTDAIYTFGMSGGGAQSALMGATGDSALYTPYLENIGAVMVYDNGTPVSDAVTGAMCWCPVTSLDIADAAYEWNMGQYDATDLRADGSWGSALSEDLAYVFAQYINDMAFQDENGKVLVLTESKDGVYAAGSYYGYLLTVIDTSLNNYLADSNYGAKYIEELNTKAGMEWVTYDASTGTASVASMKDFVANWKKATKEVAAFDDLSGTQPENRLFGNDESDATHFDPIMAELLVANAAEYDKLENWDPAYVNAYKQGIAIVDKLGTNIATRQNMYDPLYYLRKASEGFGSSVVAKHWRINTGLMQGDTASTTEVNLYLSLKALESAEVKDVEFTTVWDLPHVEAERAGGDYRENFIDWVFASEGNNVNRVIRASGAGEATVVEEAPAGSAVQSPYTIADGYDKCAVFEYTFKNLFKIF